MGRDIKSQVTPGETPLDDISGLIPKDVKTREALDRAEFANLNKAIPKYLIGKPSEKATPFNFDWLMRLHREMFGEVWTWAGKPRKTEKNIGVPPHQIGAELHKLLHDFNQWEKARLEPIEIAARLHHKLVWIHPFEGGNGRWARLITDIYLKKKGQPIMQWPCEQAVIKKEFKKEYLSALRSADHGDNQPIISLHRKYQKRAGIY